MGISITVGQILTGAALAVSVYSAVEQKAAAKDAKGAAAVSAAEQRKQFDSQQKIANIRNARERSQMARQQRVQRGQVQAIGANTGTSASSGVAGGLSSISTQAATNLGDFNAIDANQRDIVTSQGRQAGAQSAQIQAQADISSSQAMFNIGSSVFKEFGGFKTIFDSPATSSPSAGPTNSAYHGSFGE